MRVKRNKAADAAPEVTEFEAARAKWQEVKAKDDALKERFEGLRMAQSLHSGGAHAPDHNRVSQHLKDLAEPHMKVAKKRPDRIADQIRDAGDDLDDHADTLSDAKIEWDMAKQRECNRIAASLQSRQRAAVKDIAAGLEMLSRGVADELELHAELRSRAPGISSPNLPTLGVEFLDLCVSNWDSQAWRWKQKVRKLGIIK